MIRLGRTIPLIPAQAVGEFETPIIFTLGPHFRGGERDVADSV
jgi:hypothetical protein